MKYIFPIALAAMLVMPTLSVSAATMTTEERASMQVTLAYILERLTALKADAPEGAVAGMNVSSEPQNFTVTADDVVLYASNADLSASQATETCDSYAYARENYFKQVVCEYDGSVIYDYTFIPG